MKLCELYYEHKCVQVPSNITYVKVNPNHFCSTRIYENKYEYYYQRFPSFTLLVKFNSNY